MPLALVKFSASMLAWPPAMVIVAPVSTPPLSTSFTVRVGSSATAPPPPVNVTVPPAVTVGATCTSVTVEVPVLLMPLLLLPSVTVQSIVRLMSAPPLVGSALLGLTL